jgi:hypothetical protein
MRKSSLNLMHVSALIPENRTHELARILAEMKAMNVDWRAHVALPATPKIDQTTWLTSKIKTTTPARALRNDWVAAGFKNESLYPALTRAVATKQIRKVKAGHYAPSKAAS